MYNGNVVIVNVGSFVEFFFKFSVGLVRFVVISLLVCCLKLGRGLRLYIGYCLGEGWFC